MAVSQQHPSRSTHRGVALAILLAAALACLADGSARASLSSERVASGLSRPVFVTAPPGDTQRLFIVEQHSGQIRILNLADDSLDPVPFLTVGGISTGNEQGLLGLAFHPSYASNGLFYVNFTDTGGTTRIRRYQVSGDPDVADPGSATPVLSYAQPQSNHNGGWLGFGPDGHLYISSGDGGAANDSGTGHTAGTGNSQDITSNLLGKLLRIDVDGDDFPSDPNLNYAIPPTNPFVGVAGDDEIWAYGLRNPWRASFDRAKGDLYIADVGQNVREEINVQPAVSAGGENYGWRLREGMIATPSGGVGGARPPGAVDPIYDYTHGSGTTQGFSVSGGYVYRGPIAEIQGHYFFADFVTQRIWSLVFDGSSPAGFDGTNYTGFRDRTAELTPDAGAINSIASFGEDAAGNLYIVDLGGEIFRIVGAAPPVTACPAAPDPQCVAAFERGLLVVKETAGRERLVVRMMRGPALAQADLGNPLQTGGTAYDLCLYGATDQLLAGIAIDRAGATNCGGPSCWRSIGREPSDPRGPGRGYRFADRFLNSQGIRRLAYKGGSEGRSKLVVKGMGAALPDGVSGQLVGAGSATVQLRGSDASECLSLTYDEVLRDDATLFRAR